MEIRLDYMKVQPESLQTLLKLEGYVKKSGLDHKLVELIKLRASQINGCAYCLESDGDFHGYGARRLSTTSK
jgi:AhpD family alkylhydroperoxidase